MVTRERSQGFTVPAGLLDELARFHGTAGVAVAMALLSFAGGSTGCTASIPAIARRAGMSQRNARYVLSGLQRCALIEIEGQPSNRWGIGNRYTLYWVYWAAA